MTVYDPPPRQATLNPLLKLSRYEAEALLWLVRNCGTPPPEIQPRLERIAGWLEQVARQR